MNKVKVWDLAVRLSHLLFGVLVLGAFLTSEEDDLVPVHTRLGLVLLGVVLFRVVWGFVGSKHARFSDFVRSPRVVLQELRGMIRGKVGHYLGHNPVGAVMVVALLATMVTVAITGILISQGPEWSGPLLMSKSAAHAVKEVHEAAAWALPVLLVFHVAGVLLSSFLEKQNLVAGMVTGFKRAPAVRAGWAKHRAPTVLPERVGRNTEQPPFSPRGLIETTNCPSPVSPSEVEGRLPSANSDSSSRPLDSARGERWGLGVSVTPLGESGGDPSPVMKAAGFLLAALVGLGAVLLLWKLMPIGSAEAASPLLSKYEAGARAEEPSFAGFDAARGRTLYFEEHDGRTGKISCATCHTTDARQVGRSPVGKVIEPLAPSANPSRFTDAATADKWFDRNCKQVLGRTCTSRERGDFLTYLHTL